MRVRCARDYPTDEQMAALGPKFYREQSFHITVGKEYVVLGMGWYTDARLVGSGVWVDLVSDYGHLGSAPLALFSVTDDRASRYWVVHQVPEGDVTLWPPSFYRPGYHEYLADGKADIVADFEIVRSQLESEFLPASQPPPKGIEPAPLADILAELRTWHASYDVLTPAETLRATEWLRAGFPLVPPGRIRWDAVPTSDCRRWRTSDDLVQALLDICAQRRLGTPLVTILWNDVLRQAIRLPLDVVRGGAKTILDSGVGLWLICEPQRWCIEVLDEGSVCFGKAMEAPGE